MALIRQLSDRVEREQTKKLAELTSNPAPSARANDMMSFGGTPSATNGTSDVGTDDFSKLVRRQGADSHMIGGDWSSTPNQQSSETSASTVAPVFSWSTPAPTPVDGNVMRPSQQQTLSRTVTPDLTTFTPLS